MIKKTISLISFVLIAQTLSIAQDFEGFALYNKLNDYTTYLIDKNGDIAHSWTLNDPCNYAVLLMENGNIMRGATYNNNQLTGAAIGGMVQEIDNNGDVVWEFVYSTADYCSHHDITLMPDGNVLLTAWEVMSTTELTAAGYSNASSEKWPTHFIEVSQNGSGGEIVWEWHAKDHFIQDENPNEDNYGVVADHPELLDINLIASSGGGGPGGGGPGGGGGDWFHVNGINYNETLDQIVFTSRTLSELFIIDHSTTTAEAASHSGGNAGKGGDFLYRWGNPSNYGAPGTQVIPAAVHDPRWIPSGTPNAGWIQFFNNEGSNGNSCVDAIETPLNGYNYDLTPGEAYGPSDVGFRHECIENASGQSAHSRRPNGNLFVNVSQEFMYEVDADDNVIWQYNDNPAKAFRYGCSYPGVVALLNTDCNCDIGGDATIDDCAECVGGNTGLDSCAGTGFEQLVLEELTFYPNPTKQQVWFQGADFSQSNIAVLDAQGRKVMEVTNSNLVDLGGLAEGVYTMRITIGNKQAIRQVTFTTE